MHGCDQFLLRMMEIGASDVFLREDSPVTYRIDGRIVKPESIPIPKAEVRSYVDQILTPVAKNKFQATGDMDFAYSIPRHARYRINLFFHQGAMGIIARLLPKADADYASLHLPRVLIEMVGDRSGIILIVGPTGCGKSTTLASLIHHINHTRKDHIITIEDPIEFVHEEKLSLIHQRQVGYDTESFASALKHVVRQSPDVIMIGEMRDSATVQTAMSAALTGHLILSTLHTTNAVQSIDRMLNYYPPEGRLQAQMDLATSLIGIASMRLIPLTKGQGRMPAVEVLRATPTVRRIIMENKLNELYDIMKRSADLGMCSLNQALTNLFKSGHITKESALAFSSNPDELRLNLQGMYVGIESIDMRSEIIKPDSDELI